MADTGVGMGEEASVEGQWKVEGNWTGWGATTNGMKIP